jgi:capsular exopolysaccharide synthesis family protein
VTVRQYARALRRRAWMLILVPVLAVFAAVVVTHEMPPTYESQVTLLVRPAQPISSLDPTSSFVTADQVAHTYAQLMIQRPLLQKVVTDLNLRMTPEALGRDVRVTPQSGTTVLTVTVQSGQPGRARDIANKLVDSFILQTKDLQQSQINQYTTKIDAQLEQLKTQIQKEQARIDELQGGPTGANGLPARSGSQPRLNADQQSELYNLQQQVGLDRTQYNEIARNESSIVVNVARATDSVVVIAPAVTSVTPTSPKLWLNVLVAGVAGLAAAVIVVVLLEQMDQSIRSSEQLVERIGLLPLASIPSWSAGRRGEKELVALQEDPALGEPYRTLRTNILFSAIDRELRTIAISSALPKEGKSRTAANLSVALAAAGHSTLLIDCDFRRPSQHRLFGRVQNIGLADLMLQEATESEVITPVELVPNLWLLSSGPTPPNPSELLASGRMRELLARLAETFTYVVIDTPPVNLVADALVLGTYTDATLLVVEHGQSRYPAVRTAKDSLERVGARLLGAVLNKVPSREGYGYYNYNYSANGKSNHSPRPKKRAEELAAVGPSQEGPPVSSN